MISIVWAFSDSISIKVVKCLSTKLSTNLWVQYSENKSFMYTVNTVSMVLNPTQPTQAVKVL